MLMYQKLKSMLKKIGSEKISNVVMGSYSGNTLYYIGAIVLCLIITTNLSRIFYPFVMYIIFLISVFIICSLMLSRRMALGISENKILIVILGHVKLKDKDIYEFLTDRIRYITVNKILGTVRIKISFISDEGRLKKIKLSYNTWGLFVGATEYKEDALKIYNRLKEIEKIVDKGDF